MQYCLNSHIVISSVKIVFSVYCKCFLRYFYTQSKSPEPRDVVVVVHSGQPVQQLLRDIVMGTIDGLSLMDRVCLCISSKFVCQWYFLLHLVEIRHIEMSF